MSINNFYNAAKNLEFARDFQFKVRSLGPFTEQDLLYLQTAVLPAKEIVNKQIPFMGTQFNLPGSVLYTGSDDWKVTMWCDEGLNIRNKMENYISEIFNVETSTGRYGVPGELATLDMLGKNGETLRRYQLIGIYPKKVGELNYDIKGSGDPLSFDISFAYQYWTLIGV